MRARFEFATSGNCQQAVAIHCVGAEVEKIMAFDASRCRISTIIDPMEPVAFRQQVGSLGHSEVDMVRRVGRCAFGVSIQRKSDAAGGDPIDILRQLASR